MDWVLCCVVGCLDIFTLEALGALSNIESKSSAAAARMTSFDQQAKEYLAEDTDGYRT